MRDTEKGQVAKILLKGAAIVTSTLVSLYAAKKFSEAERQKEDVLSQLMREIKNQKQFSNGSQKEIENEGSLEERIFSGTSKPRSKDGLEPELVLEK